MVDTGTEIGAEERDPLSHDLVLSTFVLPGQSDVKMLHWHEA